MFYTEKIDSITTDYQIHTTLPSVIHLAAVLRGHQVSGQSAGALIASMQYQHVAAARFRILDLPPFSTSLIRRERIAHPPGLSVKKQP